jgi:hypothetical protein
MAGRGGFSDQHATGLSQAGFPGCIGAVSLGCIGAVSLGCIGAVLQLPKYTEAPPRHWLHLGREHDFLIGDEQQTDARSACPLNDARHPVRPGLFRPPHEAHSV